MSLRTRTATLSAATLMLLAGCAPVTRVLLLPQDGPQRRAVEVQSGATRQALDVPYQQASVAHDGTLAVKTLDQAAVHKRYAELLAAHPAAPRHFTLYFVPGRSELTPESVDDLATLLVLAHTLPGGEIVVIGHTDSVGTQEANDALSLQRAQAIRTQILQRGFPPQRVFAVGRGEREPAVKTADEVAEPKNRRAEIVVR